MASPATAEEPESCPATAWSMPPVSRTVVGSVRPCRTMAVQIVPVTRIERYMHIPNPKV